MEPKHIALLKREADHFMNFIKVRSKPKLIFVEKKDVPECKVNDMYEPENALYFNTDFLLKNAYEYNLLLVLHEIYHFTKQGIKDVYDVTFIRDCRQWPLMQLLDVEADLQVVCYLKEKGIVSSFPQYIAILHQGSNTFVDKQLRNPKLERFIGSMVSIHLFFEANGKIVYLPQLFFNSVLLVVVDHSNMQVSYKRIILSQEKISAWTEAFQDAMMMRSSDYAHLITLLCRHFYSTFDKPVV